MTRIVGAAGIAVVVLAACAQGGEQTNVSAHPISTSSETPQEKLAIDTTLPEQSAADKKEQLSHTVTATVYWVGEGATADNDFISNVPSAWDGDSVSSFGGIDEPEGRNFVPLHNPFYFALPAGEFTENGPIPGARESSPWADEIDQLEPDESLFKSRWTKVEYNGNIIYAQWQDVGPNEEMDYEYVFGDAAPKNTFNEEAGLDLSPDAVDTLGFDGSGEVTWQFVDPEDVESGPWNNYPGIDNRTRWE